METPFDFSRYMYSVSFYSVLFRSSCERVFPVLQNRPSEAHHGKCCYQRKSAETNWKSLRILEKSHGCLEWSFANRELSCSLTVRMGQWRSCSWRRKQWRNSTNVKITGRLRMCCCCRTAIHSLSSFVNEEECMLYFGTIFTAFVVWLHTPLFLHYKKVINVKLVSLFKLNSFSKVLIQTYTSFTQFLNSTICLLFNFSKKRPNIW